MRTAEQRNAKRAASNVILAMGRAEAVYNETRSRVGLRRRTETQAKACANRAEGEPWRARAHIAKPRPPNATRAQQCPNPTMNVRQPSNDPPNGTPGTRYGTNGIGKVQQCAVGAGAVVVEAAAQKKYVRPLPRARRTLPQSQVQTVSVRPNHGVQEEPAVTEQPRRCARRETRVRA